MTDDDDKTTIVSIEYEEYSGWSITWPQIGKWTDAETRENIIKALDIVDDFVYKRDKLLMLEKKSK